MTGFAGNASSESVTQERHPGNPRRPSLELLTLEKLVPVAGELTFAATAAAEVATGAVFTGLGFVDRQRATIEFLAIELLDGAGRLILRGEFHEREPAGLVGELVHDQAA